MENGYDLNKFKVGDEIIVNGEFDGTDFSHTKGVCTDTDDDCIFFEWKDKDGGECDWELLNPVGKVSVVLVKNESLSKGKPIGVPIRLNMKIVDMDCDNEGKVLWISKDGKDCVYEEGDKSRTLVAISNLKLPLLPPKPKPVAKKKAVKKTKKK